MPAGRVQAWIFAAPAVVAVGLLMYYPMLATIYESLFTSSFISPTPRFVGLDGYRKLLADDEFWQVVVNAITWTAGVVLLQNVIGFAVALLLDRGLPGSALVRSVVLLPWVLPGVVGAILWRFLYDPQFGLINSIALSLGILDRGVAWLASTESAMAAVVVAAVWKGFPFSTVIYLAALSTVDKEQIEAAVIDGANAWQRLIWVVIPSLQTIVLLNLLLTTIFTFNYFDMIWVTTRGGPLDATHIFPTKIYELGFGQFQFGEAATYGVVSVVVLSVFVTLYLIMLRRPA